MPKALVGDEKAARVVLRVLDQRARLFGLNRPQQVQVESVNVNVEAQPCAQERELMELIEQARADTERRKREIEVRVEREQEEARRIEQEREQERGGRVVELPPAEPAVRQLAPPRGHPVVIDARLDDDDDDDEPTGPLVRWVRRP